MAVVEDRYRGKKEYVIVYGELVTAARYRGTVTYQEIADIMGLPLTGSYMGSQVGWILGEISEDEHRRGRPLLSAIAVGTSGLPGSGFYGLARELGKLQDATKEEEHRFWLEEKAAVHDTWKKQLKQSE